MRYLGAEKKREIDAGIESGDYVLVPKGQFTIVGRLRRVDTDTSKFYTVLKRLDGEGYAKYLNKLGVANLSSLQLDSFFSFPKPVELVKSVVQGCTILSKNDSDIVLDFFSGSSTTADAVMQLNAEDGGNRRYIMVQLPEIINPKDNRHSKAAYQAGYRTIDEIGRERIKRAAAKIKVETGVNIDYGFKLFRLETPAAKTLDELDEFTPNPAEALAGDYVSKFNLDGTPGRDVVLATWLNQDGFGLLAKPQKLLLKGYTLDVYEDSAYLIEPGITSEDVQELVRLLETNELLLNRIVVFPYSVIFSVMHELKKNLSVLKSGQSVEVIERF